MRHGHRYHAGNQQHRGVQQFYSPCFCILRDRAHGRGECEYCIPVYPEQQRVSDADVQQDSEHGGYATPARTRDGGRHLRIWFGADRQSVPVGRDGGKGKLLMFHRECVTGQSMPARPHHSDTELFVRVWHEYWESMRPASPIGRHHLFLPARQHAERDDLRDTVKTCHRQLFVRCVKRVEWHSMPARPHHRDLELFLRGWHGLRGFVRAACYCANNNVLLQCWGYLDWKNLSGAGYRCCCRVYLQARICLWWRCGQYDFHILL